MPVFTIDGAVQGPAAGFVIGAPGRVLRRNPALMFFRKASGSLPAIGRFQGLGALDRQNVGTLTVRLPYGGRPEILGDLGGDMLCVEGECVYGETTIAAFRALVERMRAGSATERAVVAKYETAVNQILAAAAELQSHYISRRIPFTPLCCSYREVARQAEALTRRIGDEAGVPTMAPLFPESGSFLKALGAVALLAGVSVGGYFAYKAANKALEARRMRKR